MAVYVFERGGAQGGGAIGRDFILMNGYISLIRSTNFWRVSRFVRFMSRLGQADLIPIDHAWDALGRETATHNSPPRSENRIAEQVRLYATGTHKYPYLQNKIKSNVISVCILRKTGQLATRDDRCPYIDLGLPHMPSFLIQSKGDCWWSRLARLVIGGVYICVKAQGFKKSKDVPALTPH
ncbi:hypothetical protein TNCV_4975581 [Trichonephila clavipes]|uniref:Uncharacterized protein n=1 Tax=Trichonephila clavipes TaxID=2585209 RepID=A0A8X6SIH5_TRICX|nr:hypothetical protein TNCV_4975581 [Trichonephila clavipes]